MSSRDETLDPLAVSVDVHRFADSLLDDEYSAMLDLAAGHLLKAQRLCHDLDDRRKQVAVSTSPLVFDGREVPGIILLDSVGDPVNPESVADE